MFCLWDIHKWFYGGGRFRRQQKSKRGEDLSRIFQIIDLSVGCIGVRLGWLGRVVALVRSTMSWKICCSRSVDWSAVIFPNSLQRRYKKQTASVHECKCLSVCLSTKQWTKPWAKKPTHAVNIYSRDEDPLAGAPTCGVHARGEGGEGASACHTRGQGTAPFMYAITEGNLPSVHHAAPRAKLRTSGLDSEALTSKLQTWKLGDPNGSNPRHNPSSLMYYDSTRGKWAHAGLVCIQTS